MSKDPTDASAEFTASWTEYWKVSAQGSISLDGHGDPIAKALGDHWVAQTAWLTQRHVVLDVGSGSAVLARHFAKRCWQATQHLQWVCMDTAELPGCDMGVNADPRGRHRILVRDCEDFAQSEPHTVSQIQGTPFSLMSGVDAIVSNFGMEYVDQSGAASACRRWLPLGGHLHAVMHARDSLIDAASATGIADIDTALDGVALFDKALPMLRAIATLPHDVTRRATHARQERMVFNAAVDELTAAMKARHTPSAIWVDMLNGIRALVSQALADPAATQNAIAQLQSRQTAYQRERSRLVNMRGSCLGDAGIATWKKLLTAQGFVEIDCQRLNCADGLIAWVLRAR